MTDRDIHLIILKWEVGNICDKASKHEYGFKVSPDGDWMLKSKIWYSNCVFLGKVGSYSMSYKKDNSGWYQHNVSQIKTEICGVFRNHSCEYKEEKHDSKERSYKNSVQKTKSCSHKYHGFGDVHSSHNFFKGSTTLSNTMILNPC